MDRPANLATPKHDPQQLARGAQEVLGEAAQIVGGSAGGAITNNSLGYDGYQVGIGVLSSGVYQADVFLERDLSDNEFDVGKKLGRKLEQSGASSVLFFYDSLKRPAADGGPELNLATPILEGMEQSLSSWPSVAGAGLVADAAMLQPSYLLLDDQVIKQSAMALAFSGGVQMGTLILHGCKPASPYHTITRTEGNAVLEIDGEPALEMVDKMLGQANRMNWKDFPFFITLGLNRGDKFEAFDAKNYANRLCFSVDADKKALIMFEPDLQPGDEVQLMRRSIDLDYVGDQIKEFRKQLKSKEPFFARYIDCVGRASAYSGTEEEEASEVQRHIGDIPLLGFYSGVEVARCGSDIQALDWTGVLCIFSDPKSD